MLLSIIVPVYNVEKYIKECIDSILCQSFKDYEVILVDDGSKDRSGKICDIYSEGNSKIHVIHKENGGLSDARNCGIKEAKGKYLLFVDSDDYIEKESFKKIVECLEKQNRDIDLMFLEATKVYPDNTKESMGDGYQEKFINGKSKDLCMWHLVNLPKFPAAACTKLVNRKFILSNELLFEKELLSEDVDWTIRVLMKAQNFAYCPYNYYYYRQGRPGSITNTSGLKSANSLLWIIKRWSSQSNKLLYQSEINSFLAYEYIMVLMIYASLDKDIKKKLIQEIESLKWLLRYASTRKTKSIAWICKVFGVHYGAHISRRLDKIRRNLLGIRRKLRK